MGLRNRVRAWWARARIKALTWLPILTTQFEELMELLQSILPLLIFVSVIGAIMGALRRLGRM